MADVESPDLATALALHQQGRLDEAEPLYRQILVADQDHADALSLLGTLCHQTGRHEEALDLLTRATTLRPDQAGWHANLGVVLKALERYPEGATALRRALELRPNYPEALSNLGLVLHQMGDFIEAIKCFAKAIELRPDTPGFHLNLGNTYLEAELFEEAAESFRKTLEIQPKHLPALTSLALACNESGQYAAAEEAARAALAATPDSPQIHRILGSAIRDQGRMEEALDIFDKANVLQPTNTDGRQARTFIENYLGKHSPSEALARAKALGAMFETGSGAPFANRPDPNRRLRVGFVSGDFRRHPVGQYFSHLLPHFDRGQVEVILYANQKRSDQITADFKAHADLWRDIDPLGDDDAEALIRADRVDILVDLSGHTGLNRMPLLARRAAPVQATWLGYSGTTGVPSIDYIVADENVIPPGDEHNFSETPIRLPGAYLCYAPPRFSGFTVDPTPPPMLKNGFVTFGSYNKLDKMNDETVACWARVLLAVPGSRLLLKSATLDNPEIRRATESRFARHGVDANRLILKGQHPSYLLHFQSYGEIDICLDPFPYNGTTTSCDALWMGVPIVTLVGDRFISRVGSSLMRAVGLDDLVANTLDDYVASAARLAGDTGRLKTLRSELRPTLLSSPLGDAPRFVRNFEAALRQMWQAWCVAESKLAAS